MASQRYEKQTAFTILTLFATAVATYLVWHHIAFHSGYQRGNSLCSINQWFDCGKIERSPYSVVFGIPTASFAFFFYLMFAAFVGLPSKRSGMSEKTFAAITLLAATTSLLASLTFASLSLFKIGAVCLFCSMLYLISITLFLMALRVTENKGNVAAQLKLAITTGLRYFVPFLPLASAVPNIKRLRLLSLASVCCLAILVYIVPEAIETRVLIPKMREFMVSEEAKAALKEWLATPAQDISIVSEPAENRDFSLGPASAPITIVEFSDFECPHCQVTAPRVHELLERYAGAVRVVFKHYPLDISCNRHLSRKLHEFACRAAAMNRCAGILDEQLFFPMADALFALGNDFSDESLANVVHEMPLNLTAFSTCLSNPQTLERVKKDIEEAARLGIQGTPTFFANGRRVPGNAIEVLPIIIENILQQQSGT